MLCNNAFIVANIHSARFGVFFHVYSFSCANFISVPIFFYLYFTHEVIANQTCLACEVYVRRGEGVKILLSAATTRRRRRDVVYFSDNSFL